MRGFLLFGGIVVAAVLLLRYLAARGERRQDSHRADASRDYGGDSGFNTWAAGDDGSAGHSASDCSFGDSGAGDCGGGDGGGGGD